MDNQPLVLSDVRTSSTLIPGQSSKVQTVLSWHTNKPATSRVSYDTSLSGPNLRNSTPENQGYVTDHVVIVSDFAPGSIYRVRVQSTDGTGKTRSSDDYSLLTPKSEANIVDIIFQNFRQAFSYGH